MKGGNSNSDFPDMEELTRRATKIAKSTPIPSKPDLLEELRHIDTKLPITRNYLHIRPRMLSILYEWMFQVMHKFRRQSEVLALAIRFVELLLTKIPNLKTGKLQLVGATALLLASKILDVYPPEIRDMIDMTAGTITQSQIVDMEWRIIQAIQGYAWNPNFLRYIYLMTQKNKMPNIGKDTRKKLRALATKMAFYVALSPTPVTCHTNIDMPTACLYIALRQLGLKHYHLPYSINNACLKNVCHILSSSPLPHQDVLARFRKQEKAPFTEYGLKGQLKRLEMDCNKLMYEIPSTYQI